MIERIAQHGLFMGKQLLPQGGLQYYQKKEKRRKGSDDIDADELCLKLHITYISEKQV